MLTSLCVARLIFSILFYPCITAILLPSLKQFSAAQSFTSAIKPFQPNAVHSIYHVGGRQPKWNSSVVNSYWSCMCVDVA